MVGMQIASGILAAGMVVAGAPCSYAADRATAAAPAPALASQHPSDTPVFTQPLPNVKGKTFTSVIVYFPPDARAAPHRHGSAFVYAYVLEGTVRSQLAGGASAYVPPRPELGRAAGFAPPAHGKHQPDKAGEAAGRLHLEYGGQAQDQ